MTTFNQFLLEIDKATAVAAELREMVHNVSIENCPLLPCDDCPMADCTLRQLGRSRLANGRH